MNRVHIFALLISAGLIAGVCAQTQKPIVIQAANATPATKAATVAPAANAGTTSNSTAAAIKLLEAMKAANTETLKHQEDTMNQLDEVQKAATQMRIFSKRG